MATRLENPSPPEPDVEGSSEEGRTSLRVGEGAPSWLNVPLYGVLVIGVLFLLMTLIMGWASWALLLGVILVVVGLGIALNPRRSSPMGGTGRG